MASYQTTVEAVNRVYKQEGGTYEEGTAPMLIKIASEVFDALEGEIRTQPDSVEAVLRVHYDDILQAILRHT